MDNKVNLEDDFDFGFSTVTTNDIEIKDIEERLIKVEKLIMPLLDNLMKDPDKDIHWPDRDIKLTEFKEKLSDIIRGVK